MIYYWLPVIIGFTFAISQASNQGKLLAVNGWPQWFTYDSWNNKNTWKPVPIWRVWPFVEFTDAFHFFLSVGLVAMCFLPLITIDFTLFGDFIINRAVAIFGLYSISFQIFYWLLPYLRLK